MGGLLGLKIWVGDGGEQAVEGVSIQLKMYGHCLGKPTNMKIIKGVISEEFE